MHNIDRNMLEANHEGAFETGDFEYEQFEGPLVGEYAQEAGEFGFEAEGWSGETEAYETESYEAFGQGEAAFSESEEMELAAELLEISNEQELEQFLGKLVRKAGAFLKSPAGKALGGVLKGLAKKALPIAGTALGGFVGGPLGAKIGQGLVGAAGQALGLEAETLSHEDREFEGARQFVRIAGQTARHMARARSGDPRFAAQQAMFRAVRRNAPGLLQPSPYRDYDTSGYSTGGGRRQSGRWMRRGNRIVLFGV